jgi:dTDP-4-amino-4,6-dideoxygalactose transaminase
MHVKFLDIQAQYPLIKEDILKNFDDVLSTGHFIGMQGSKYLEEFEAQFASYCETDFSIAVSNGTSALWMIIYALGIGPGDEVIIPANTFMATAEAVSLVGATPVFVDINHGGYDMDGTAIIASITVRTKAIIPVHMYGQCGDMDTVLKIAKAHNLFVIEDSSQAHGAKYKDRKAGSMGIAASFSFYPGKNLGAWGEGGAITTNDKMLATKLRAIRNHGSIQRYKHDVIGGNFRLDELQSAVLTVKMKYIESWNASRRTNAKLYLDLLKTNKHIVLPPISENQLPVWHLFVIRVRDRVKFMEHLEQNNIQSAIHYPTPLHLTDAYKHLGYKLGDIPVSESIQSEIISLPMYAEITEHEIKYVCDVINNFFSSSSYF